MTLSEFKAWFEGYTEGLEAAPTKAQFDRIKEKVKAIDGTVTAYPVYVDRYVRQWPSYAPNYPVWTSGNIATSGIATGVGNISPTFGFDVTAAMYALGKAEAAN